ncbi:MAG: PilW family protein [Thermodesulfobacteriota bacterium]
MNKIGFTLVELVMAMLITSIISIVLYSTFSNQIKIYVNQKKINQLKNDLSITLDFIERDLRLAGFDPFDKADVGFVEALDDKMVFQGVDYKKDFSEHDDLRRIYYEFSSGRIKRIYNSSVDDGSLNDFNSVNYLSENIDSLNIKYENSDKEIKSSADYDKIEKVTVTIKASISLWGRSDYKQSITSTFNCRNMRI